MSRDGDQRCEGGDMVVVSGSGKEPVLVWLRWGVCGFGGGGRTQHEAAWTNQNIIFSVFGDVGQWNVVMLGGVSMPESVCVLAGGGF